MIKDIKYIGTGDIICYRGKYYTVGTVTAEDYFDGDSVDRLTIDSYRCKNPNTRKVASIDGKTR